MVNAARELARDKQGRRQVILKFNDFEAIIQFAKMMQEEVGDSKIIEYNKAYYLELSFDDSVSQTGLQDILSLIHISEPTRRTPISYAVFCLKKKKKRQTHEIFSEWCKVW